METKTIKYFALIIFLSYGLTILSHIALKPFWKMGDNTTITSIETILTIIIIPICLLLIYYFLSVNYSISNKGFLILNTIIILSCIWISSKLHFYNWAHSVGNINNPDNATTEVIGFERIIGYILSLIGLAITYNILKRKLTGQQ